MADLLLTPVVVGTFPSGASYNLDQYSAAFASRLQVTIPSSTVLFGQLGGAQPVAPLAGNGTEPGLWESNSVLYQWDPNSAAYMPMPATAGQLVNGVLRTVTLKCTNVTSSTTLAAPIDRSGTIALTSDVVTFTGTNTLAYAATVNVDATTKKQAYIVLAGNVTLNITGMADGQSQVIFVENPTANTYTVTVTVPTGIIIWSGASQPAQTAGASGKRTIDMYEFRQAGLVCFARAVAQNWQIATSGGGGSGVGGSDTTPPTATIFDALTAGPGSSNQGPIQIGFNKLLTGGVLSGLNWTVTKNNNPLAVTSAQAIGSVVFIGTSGSWKPTSTGTIKYTGTDVKDLAGNQAAAFGPTNLTMTSSGPGSGG